MNKMIFQVIFESDRLSEILEYRIPLSNIIEGLDDPLKKIIDIHNQLIKKARKDSMSKFGEPIKEIKMLEDQL